MNRRWLVLILLVVIIAVALLFRVVLPWDMVFGDGWTRLLTVDAYGHMRVVDSLVANWPTMPTIDVYKCFPAGVVNASLFHYLIGGITVLFDCSQDIVAAWLPPIMAILTIVAVFFLTKMMFGLWPAAISSGLLAVFCTEYMSRSMLGAADYHVMEVLLTTCAMLFLILAVRQSKMNWKAVVFSCLMGVFLLLYRLTWQGAIMFALIIGGGLGLWFLIRLVRSRRWWWLGGYLGAGIASLAVLWVVSPTTVVWGIGTLRGIFIWHIGSATSEELPMLWGAGGFTLLPLWANFTMSFYLALVAFGVLTYLVVKRNEADKTLLLVWGLVTVLMMLSMRRFTYYAVIPVAIMSGWMTWTAIRILGRNVSKVKYVLTAALILALVFVPNLSFTTQAATKPGASYYDAAWREAMMWLRDETPEPYGDADCYWDCCEGDPDYTVVSWWDYGYWITRDARRVPVCHPGGGWRGLVGCYLTQEGDDAEVIKALKVRYVVIDWPMTTWKFYAMAYLANLFGHSEERVADYQEGCAVWFQEGKEGRYETATVYYPEYYRSLAVRLYNFNGESVIPRGTPVLTFVEHDTYKEIVDVHDFPTYEDALTFIEAQESGNHMVAGTDPFVSPVPLEPLDDYKLVFESKALQGGKFVDVTVTPKVKIFEYLGGMK